MSIFEFAKAGLVYVKLDNAGNITDLDDKNRTIFVASEVGESFFQILPWSSESLELIQAMVVTRDPSLEERKWYSLSYSKNNEIAFLECCFEFNAEKISCEIVLRAISADTVERVAHNSFIHMPKTDTDYAGMQQLVRMGNWYVDYSAGRSYVSPELLRLHHHETGFTGSYPDLLSDLSEKDRRAVSELLSETKRDGVYKSSFIVTQIKGDDTDFLSFNCERIYREGRLQFVRGVVYDITDQKRLENAQRSRADSMEQLIRTLPDPVLLIDKKELIIWEVNEKAHSIYKDTPLVGKSYLDIDPDSENSGLTLEKSLSHPVVKQHTFKDHHIHVEINSSLLTFHGIELYLVVVRDISERVALQDEINETGRRLQLIMDSAPFGLYWKDLDLRYTGANSRFLSDIGEDDLTAILGLRSDALMSEYDDVDQGDSQVIETGKAILNREVPVKMKGRLRHWIRLNRVPVRDDHNKLIGVLGSYVDITKEKKVFDDLKASESLFRGLFESSNSGVFVIDYIGAVVKANRAFCDMIHYSEKELRATHISNYTAAVSLDEELAYLEDLQDGRINQFRMRKQFRCSDDTVFWGDLSLVRVNLKGRAPLFVGVVIDIDREVKHEKILQESEAQLTLAQGIAKLGSWRHEIKSGKITCSDEAFRIFGVGKTEFDNIDFDLFMSLVHPDDREYVRDKFIESLHTKERSVVEHRIVLSDGTVKYVQRNSLVELSDSGEVIAKNGTVLDITRLKEAEEKIFQSESLLKRAQKIAKVGHWTHDLQSGKVTWSDELYRIYELEKKETIDMDDYVSQIHPDDRDKLRREYHRAIKEKRELSIEHRLLLKNGAVKYVQQNAVIEFSENGDPLSTVGTTLDITKQKEAELLLMQSEERYRALYTSNTAIVLVNLEGKIIDANSAFVEILEYDNVSDLIGRTVHSITYYEDLKKSYSNMTKLVQSGNKRVKIEKRYITRSGKIIHGMVSSARCSHSIQEGDYFISVFTNVTPYFEMQKLIQESEEKFRMVADYASDWVYWIDVDNRFKYIAPSVKAITGYDVEWFQDEDYRKIISIVHEDDREDFQRHVELNLQGKEREYEKQFRIVKESGEVRWVAHTSNPIIYKGEYLGLRVSNRDITENRELSIKIEQSERRFTEIANNIEEIFWLIGIDGSIQMVNRAFEKIFGYRSSDYENIWEIPFWTDDEKSGVMKYVRDMAEAGVSHFSIETRWLTCDEKIRVCRNNFSSVLNEHGEISSLALTTQDVTSFKKMAEREKIHDEQLRQADKMTSLGILVSGVAHEINNPNNLIMLNGAFLSKIWSDIMPVLEREAEQNSDLRIHNLEYSVIAEKLPKIVDSILMGSERIKGIVHGLKEFVRVDTGRLDYEIEINNVVENSIIIVHNVIRKSSYNFSVEYGEDIPLVKGNIQQLEQVIINLLTNACQSLTDVEQPIAVRTSFENGEVCVSVKDGGVGISEESMKKIRDPFYTTKRDSGGTGLGLSVSHSIMEAHGGRLDYFSKVDCGTEVHMLLPVNRTALE